MAQEGLARLVLLGELRGASGIITREIKTMPIQINIERNPILKEIFAEGEAKGEARGKAEGEVRGKADSLLRLRERRFGPVPPARREKVNAADIATLDRWLDRIFDAPTLDAVFDGPTAN